MCCFAVQLLQINCKRMALENVGTFVLTDDTLDSHSERVIAKGVDLTRFKSNPIMFFNHLRTTPGWFGESVSVDTILPIGTWKNVKKADGQITADAYVDFDDEFAAKIGNKVKTGIIRAVSIGFRALAVSDAEEDKVMGQKGYTVTKSELWEASLVDIPANPNALVVSKSIGQRVAGDGAKTGGDDLYFVKTLYRVDPDGENQTTMSKNNLFDAIKAKAKSLFGQDIETEDQAVEFLEKVDPASNLNVTELQSAITEAVKADLMKSVADEITGVKAGYQEQVDALVDQVSALVDQVEALSQEQEQVKAVEVKQTGKIDLLAKKINNLQSGKSGRPTPVEGAGILSANTDEPGDGKGLKQAAVSMTEALAKANGRTKFN